MALPVLLVGLIVAVFSGSGAEAQSQRPPRRESLIVCVKPAGGAVVDETRALTTIQTTLNELAQHEHWWRWDFKDAPLAELNCDHQPVLLQPGVTVTKGTHSSSRSVPTMPVVQQQGKYAIIISVLPPSEIDRLYFFSDAHTGSTVKYRTETEEYFCEGHVCIGLTTGLYVTPDEVVDGPVMREALENILGLDRAPRPGEPRTAAERAPTPLTIPDPGKPYAAAGRGAGSTDLVVTDFTSSPAPAISGADVTLTYAVKNVSNTRASAVRLLHQLPNGVGTRGFKPSQGGCAYEPRIVCDVGDIEPGGEVRVSINGLADTGTATEGSLRVYALSREPDQTPRDNRGAHVVTIAPAPDLVVTAAASPARATVGQEVTVTYTVTNRGPGALTGVDVSVSSHPGDLTQVRSDPQCPREEGPVRRAPETCDIAVGNLAAGQSVTLTAVVTPRKAGVHSISASAFGDETGQNRDNQTAVASITVDPTIDLAVSISGPSGPVQAGDPLTYAVTVENRSAELVELAEILIPYAPGAQVIPTSTDPTRRTCALQGATPAIGCYVQQLAGGASATVEVSLVAGPIGEVVASARVESSRMSSSSQGDIDLSNNVSSTITTTVVPRSCAPRPPISVQADPGSADRLRVLIEATTNESAPENRLGRIRIGSQDGAPAPTTNALIDLPRRLDGSGPGTAGRSGTFDIEPGRVSRSVFFIRRAQPGQEVSVPLTVEDDCGSWSTVVTGSAAPWGNAFDVQATASANGSIRVGERVTYTATVANTGETGSNGTVAVVTLPAGLTLVSGSVERGSCGGRSLIICEVGRLEPGARVTMTLVAEAREAGAHAVTVYAASEAFDRENQENMVTVRTEVGR